MHPQTVNGLRKSIVIRPELENPLCQCLCSDQRACQTLLLILQIADSLEATQTARSPLTVPMAIACDACRLVNVPSVLKCKFSWINSRPKRQCRPKLVSASRHIDPRCLTQNDFLGANRNWYRNWDRNSQQSLLISGQFICFACDAWVHRWMLDSGYAV